jgi:phage baseplate assembly protein W
MANPIRSDRFTVKTNQVTYYSDFMISFAKNPVTGYLAKVTNEAAIEQSLKSLILTQRTERFMQPYVGSKIYALLFEPNDVGTNLALQQEIKTTIQNCEPRVTVLGIIVQNKTDGLQPDDNSLDVTINYSINAIPDQNFSLDLTLNRTR